MAWSPHPTSVDNLVSNPLFDSPRLSPHVEQRLLRIIGRRVDDLENLTGGNVVAEASWAKILLDLTVEIADASRSDA